MHFPQANILELAKHSIPVNKKIRRAILKVVTSSNILKLSACAMLLGSVPATVHATEGGVSMYPNGTENFMLGALPPPGTYGMLFGNHYQATQVNDNRGNSLNIPGFKVEANVLAARFAWLPKAQFMGGDLVAHVVVPLVNLNVNVAGASQTKTGIGDITTGVGVGYHHSPNLHSVVAVDFFLPTGDYNRSDLANIGKNHWGFEPALGLTYVDPKGFNGDLKFGLIFNGKNSATDYTSGREFHFDYAAGWGFGNGWTAGVGGYVYRQVSDDTQAGVAVQDNRGSAMSIGPNVKYDSGKGWFATLKWEKETNVKNRAQGESIWLKAVFPL